MIIDILVELVKSLALGARQQSEPDVYDRLRNQTINIIDDLVDKIVPDVDYKKVIYEEGYESLCDEFGLRRFRYVNHRNEIFDLLRDVPLGIFFAATEHLLKHIYRKVVVPGQYSSWDREVPLYEEYNRHFETAVDGLNCRLFQHEIKYRYVLRGGSVEMANLNAEEDNQPPERHPNQSLTEFWNKKSYRIAVIVVILTALLFLFGDNVLVRLWDYLPTTIKEKIAGWFR